LTDKQNVYLCFAFGRKRYYFAQPKFTIMTYQLEITIFEEAATFFSAVLNQLGLIHKVTGKQNGGEHGPLDVFEVQLQAQTRAEAINWHANLQVRAFANGIEYLTAKKVAIDNGCTDKMWHNYSFIKA